MSVPQDSEAFGCERCCPPSAEAAWEARSELTRVADLIHESHFIVTVAACAGCAQHFVSVFTETLDWVAGNDPQEWTLLPVLPGEVQALLAQGAALDEHALEALGPVRRSLRRSSPNDSPTETYWSCGLRVGWHD